MVLRNLDSHMQKNETGPFLHHTQKLTQWIKDLNEITETTKLPEENKGSNLLDSSLSDEFLDLSPQARATRAKINKRDYTKLKSF